MQELKNKYLYSKYSSKQKQFDIIQMSQSKEFIDRIKEIEEKNEFDIKSKEKIKIMDKNINEKQLKYISEFEIVNMKTISYLKIIYNDFSNYYCEGEYYMAKTQYSNIIISFQDSEGNYHYQIGKVDENNLFNVNYIFNFNTSYNSSDLLKNILLKKEEEFFNKIYYYRTNNEFIVNDNIKCNFYKLNFNDELDCLKNLFFAINEFENLFKKEVSKKERIYTHEDCYLINKKCLNEFKDIFLYNNYINDKNIFINNKQKIFDIFSDKSKYEKIFDKENDLKNDIYLTIKNVKYFYPYDFNIINNEIFNRLNDFTKFLDINLSKNLFNKTPLIINDKKIIITIMHYEILVIKIDENNELISEMIIAFDKIDIKETVFKMFKEYKFNFDEVISFIYDKNDNIIGNLYLINNKENKKYIKDSKINSEENIKNYLKIILEFYKLNKYIKDKKSKKINITPCINEEELFITNKKWLDEFKYIFSYDEILTILNKNKDMILEEKENEKIIKSIYNMISAQSKQFLNNLNDNIIQTKFNNKNLYKIFNKKCEISDNNFLIYFSSCLIINKKILDLLKVNYKVHKANFIFGDDKIFINLDTMIKIGILKHNLFITEYIICSENKEISTQIKNVLSIKGFEYINSLLKVTQSLKIRAGDIIFLTKVDKLNLPEFDDSNIKNLDEKLKVLLILCIYQLKFKVKKNEGIYMNDTFLLDSNFLSEIYYDNLYNIINNIVENNNDIKSDIESNKTREREILYKLNKYINSKTILDIENKLKNKNSQNCEKQSFYAKKIKIILKDKKDINVYDNFVIVDKNIIKIIRDTFDIKIKNDNNMNISYVSSKQKELILVKDCNKQNILLGNILSEGNHFKLEYIFDYYDNKENIKSEVNRLINSYDMYFKNSLIFNEKYKNDCVSPVFSEKNKDIIGYCYKHDNNLMINDYTKFSININLRNILYVYIYDSILINNIIKTENLKLLNDFYIVNSNFLKEFKTINNYEVMKNELNNMKDNAKIIDNIYNGLLNNKICIENTKYFYILLKVLNPEININFNVKKEEIALNEKRLNPEINEMNYYDSNFKENKKIKIDSNFELINKNVISLFIKNNLQKNQVTYDIINDYILINYPKGIYENSQFITLIGNNNNKEFLFTTKYILIYYSDEERLKHIKILKKYLSNYLKGISLINNNAPIINDKYEIIGIIIRNDNNIDNNSNTNFIKEYKELELKYNGEKEKINNLNNKIEELKGLLNKEKKINLDLNNKIKETTNNNINKETLLKEEISKNNNLKTKNDELTKELKNIKLKDNDLQNTIKKLENELQGKKTHSNDLFKKNNELMKEIQNQKLNNTDLQNKIKKVNYELEKEKNNNNNLKNELNELKETLNNVTNIKIELNETILSKESMLNENKSKLKELNQKIKDLENIIENSENDSKNKLIKLFEELKSKENEIKEIQSRYPVLLSKGEKLICVILISVDQKFHYPIICKSNDKFTKLEELLYEEFPELSESENIFLVNGKKVNRFKTIEFNGIKYGDIITFYQVNQ